MCFVFQFFFPSTTVGSCATSITWHQGQRRACMFAQRAAGQSREGCACMASDVRKLEKEWPLLLLAINGKAVASCWNSFARSARVLVSRSQQKSNSRLAVKKNYKWHIKSVMSFAPSISPRWKSRVCASKGMSTGLQLSKLWCPLFLHLLCTCPAHLPHRQACWWVELLPLRY
jgi:hypothetical protein